MTGSMSKSADETLVVPVRFELDLQRNNGMMAVAEPSRYPWPMVGGGRRTFPTCFLLVEDDGMCCSKGSDGEAEGMAALGRRRRGRDPTGLSAALCVSPASHHAQA